MNIMNQTSLVTLNGDTLGLDDIIAIGQGTRSVILDPRALARCQASRRFLEKAVAEKQVIYGVNTSYGPMCNKIINDRDIETLQHNLILSHAAGLGDPLAPHLARATLAIRLNTLVKGYSGVRLELLEQMRDVLNAGIAPYIPECGSVGASGDLIHLAHMTLSLLGLGPVFFRGQEMEAKEALSLAGLTPLRLACKEGLALINGTAAMTAIAAFALADAEKLCNVACVNAAFAVEIFGGISDAFDVDLHRLKPHPGQLRIAETIEQLCRGTGNLTCRDGLHQQIRAQENGGSVFETSITVQDVYSLRCTPQILAPVAEAIASAKKTIEIEANSSNDNPLIIPESGKILHGGNFHGQSISVTMDTLCLAISTLCNLSERRLNKLLDKSLSEGLPEHLIAGEIGLTMGFMGAQYLATSTTAENRNLAAPMSVNSISCNAANQDVVSMGTVAARKALRVVENAKHVLTLETLADLQALSFRNADRLGRVNATLYELLAAHFTPYDNQRIFHDDLVRFRHLLFSGDLFTDLGRYHDN